MTHDEIVSAVKIARDKFDDVRKNSYCWIVAQAIIDNSNIISPDNFDFLNQQLRLIGVELSSDFFRAYKTVPKAYQAGFAQLIYSQDEILAQNILGSGEIDEDDVDDEDAALAYNFLIPANQQQYDEFILREYRTILTLAANGKIQFDSHAINQFFCNASAPIIVQIWKDPEFAPFFEQLAPEFRLSIVEAIFNKMQTNGPARNELLNSPLPNGDLFLHVVAKLPVKNPGYDIRVMLDEPAANEFKSTTCIIVELIPEEKNDDGQAPVGPLYKIKKIIQSNESGELIELKEKDAVKNRGQLAGLSKALKLHEPPLNGLDLARKPSIKSLLPFKSYETVTDIVLNRKGATHYSLMEDVIHHATFEETNFWAATPAGDSAVVLAAKNKATLSVTPFIAIKKHADAIAQQKQLEDKEQAKELKEKRPPALGNNEYYYLDYYKKHEVDERLAAERKEDEEIAQRIRQRQEMEAKQDARITQELGKAALFAASQAKTDADWQVVTDLLDNGANSHLFDNQSPYSIAHYAVLDNRIDLFNRITGANKPFEVRENGADINYHNPNAQRPATPLICAAESPNVKMETFLALLNLEGIQFNHKAAGETALFNAAKKGQTDKVMALLAKRGIDVESKRRPGDGKTASQIAEVNKHHEIANILKLDTLIMQLYDNNLPRHADTSFMKGLKQEQIDQVFGNFLNRNDYDENKFNRTSFILSECLAHYNPPVAHALIAPVPVKLDLAFTRADFVATSTKLNSMFSLARHSSENKKYEWLGDIRAKALERLFADVAALPEVDLAGKKELLVNARQAGVFARHRSTCCFFRFGRTDTQVKIDKMISDINDKLGLAKDDRYANVLR